MDRSGGYPLYLIHQNVGYMVFNQAGPVVDQRVLFWGVVAAAIGTALLVHVIVEKPAAGLLKRALLRSLDALQHRARALARRRQGSTAISVIVLRDERRGRSASSYPARCSRPGAALLSIRYFPISLSRPRHDMSIRWEAPVPRRHRRLRGARNLLATMCPRRRQTTGISLPAPQRSCIAPFPSKIRSTPVRTGSRTIRRREPC
ncbi:hypothetical protein [Burkholderia sp. ABCPW 11]|uniref:hypothetical protein n=1 Tax=Burkholderia sp. ABCPW 11 TaxID=1637859 RepID=UPI0012FD2284|nr:hypothetical protein [Burkholderia sp. ABCPW 11]